MVVIYIYIYIYIYIADKQHKDDAITSKHNEVEFQTSSFMSISVSSNVCVLRLQLHFFRSQFSSTQKGGETSVVSSD